jgi:hypothetical protein
MKKVIVGLSCLVMSVSLFAQTAWNRAIGSEAGLESYCLEHSTRAYIGVWGGDDVIAISNANQYAWVYSSDPLKLAEKVSIQKLGYGIVAGSTAPIQKSCQFYDENYRLMYFGYTEGKIIKIGDISSLVWKDMEMTVPDSFRMSLPEEYQWAYIYLKFTDENGNTRYIYLGQGKEFDWLKSFAGYKDARLLVRGYTTDGYTLNQVVDVASGEFMPIEEMVEDFNSIKMEGFSYHTNSLVYVVGATNSIGKSPLFQLTSATNAYGMLKSVGISVKTSENERPLGFYYRKVDGAGAWPDWQYLELRGLDVEGFKFPEGIYHLDFKFPKLHSEDWKRFQNYNNNNGGQG